jgi:tripartite ATP-independent transporter DctP family solute receptor
MAKMILVVGLAILIITSASSAMARSKKVTIRVGHVNPPGEPAYAAWELFKRTMERRLGRKVVVKIYPQGQLGNERDLIEQTKLGSIQMTATAAAPLALHNPHLGIYNLPYLFKNEDELWSITDGPIGLDLAEETARKGILVLDHWSTGVRHIFSKEPVRTVDDMRGVKIRVMESPIFIAAFRGVGAQPTPLPYGEVYQALATGVVDAAENDSSGYRNMKFFEPAPVYSLTAHNIIPKPVQINPLFYKKLPDDVRRVLLATLRECTIYQRTLFANNFATDLEWLKKQGVTVVPDVDKKGFQKLLVPIWAEFNKTIGADLIKAVKKELGI